MLNPLRKGQNFMKQEDNDPKNTSKMCKTLFRTKTKEKESSKYDMIPLIMRLQSH